MNIQGRRKLFNGERLGKTFCAGESFKITLAKIL